jgi:FimV-like protein
VIRILFFISGFLIFNAHADISISSPKLKFNNQDERIIEFRINDEKIQDDDIVIKAYKSDDILEYQDFAYLILKNYEDYQILEIIIDNKFEENYFSFRIEISNEVSKDIFVFLPSRLIDSEQKVTKNIIEKNSSQLVYEKKLIPEISEEPTKDAEQIINADEITTMWSLASQFKEETNASIYQIMWSIYLGNKDAFIKDNINLIRNDIDIIIPTSSQMTSVSDDEARSSILKMNKSFSIDFAPAAKSLLVLTAPKIQSQNVKINTNEKQDEKIKIDLSQENAVDAKSFIEKNTKTLVMDLENDPISNLIEESKNKPNEISDTGLSRFDLLFVAIISVLSGILIALIYIQLKSKKDNKIKYDFIEAADNDSKIDGLPKGLSIENNHDEQQIDLAYTYYEMGNYEDAVKILNQIIKNSKITSIKTKAEELLAMIQK